MINSNFYRELNQNNGYRIFIFKDYNEARGAFEVCKYKKFIDPKFPNFYLLNEFRAKRGDDLRSYSFELGEMLYNLSKFYHNSNSLLLAPLHSILHPLPKLKWLESIHLELNKECNFSNLIDKLIYYGYERLDLIHAPKEMAIHGDIIDIFSHNFDNPLRISFFDNEIESIKFFDVVTQKCFGNNITNIDIFPALFSLDSDEFDSLEEEVKNSSFDAFIKDIHSLGFWFIDEPLISKQFKSLISPTAFNELKELEALETLSYLDFDFLKSINKLELVNTYTDIESSNSLSSIISLHKNKSLTILSKNELLLNNLEIPANAKIIKEYISLNIITPNELILSLNKISKLKARQNKTIRLNELNNGDYIVHSDYGIGIFNGIVQTSVLGNTSDFIEILYLNNDKLLIPTHNLNLIDKYIANTSSIPVLDKLGKGSFAKIKEKVRPKLLEIAKEIIDIAAQRELIKGKVIDTNNVENLIFKQSSNFELTTDQDKSINEIFNDLSSGRVMDRLLIGDVGFGKTEVAMNAIFAVVKSGFQASLIVPTTLLSNQHFKSLKTRFEKFNIKIAKLDRFAKSKKTILDGLKNGDIEVIVGTHSLLNASFKNLGLVVLDEEHKFGVKQKEKLKNLTKDVHILSMSATPIPRTLNLALSHIKTQSSLNTPPSIRVPPKTFVKNYNDMVLKDAILRELRRNGQIFYIHNNITSITSRKNEILKILPKLKIAILHSKINESETESIMIGFANGEFDVLLSTSIVESGIHLPNANTIIVDSADCFGMADLHQLRGRIGRGDKEGYCYFFVDDKDNITSEAKKRLLSLESNSFLGSGGILSYTDLEIRGGGNILGEAQSGHINNIGYSLYLKMLEDSINYLSGKEILNKRSVDVKLNISAFLNSSIIPSDRIRLDLYRRLSNIESKNDIYDIEEEINDRFGKLDSFSMRFLRLILIKFIANTLNIKAILNYNQHITIILKNDEKVMFDASDIDDDSILDAVLEYLRKQEK
ncbi:transcription-repair coupling factor [Helicobacter sp. MIT 14-3879]|uniref:transcription-repair coupling factor n=1 Tax=Helicobacter sp. MIT 14-3879 TaxID=2040649 RepID=UPI000E1F06C0|nr:transcription-repair coupling factor [Helicobacter sp. MIT 14-3879]RDU65430.1 transcription-repair coupling factor [Helicobacter sp. MIT 14-3879]